MRDTHSKWLPFIILAIAAALFVIATGFLTHDIRRMRAEGYLHRVGRGNQALRPEDIRGWMTFDYINRNFGIPPSYLKNKINITSSRYPIVTVGEVAEQKGVTSDELLRQIRDAIGQLWSVPQ